MRARRWLKNTSHMMGPIVTRKAALTAGLARYFTGKPCKRGHFSERSLANGCCNRCMYERDVKATEIDPHRARDKSRRVRESKPGYQAKWAKVRRASLSEDERRAFDLNNRTKAKEKDRVMAWARSAANGAKQRARRKGVPFDINAADVYALRTTHCPALGCELVYCNPKRIVWNSAQLDRIVPALGYVKGNLRILSKRANLIKTDASPKEIMLAATFLRATD